MKSIEYLKERLELIVAKQHSELITTDGLAIPVEEWAMLTDRQQQFLHEANRGGMRTLAENMEVFAWGHMISPFFSTPVEACGNTLNGWVVVPDFSGPANNSWDDDSWDDDSWGS